jgi:hypothetical protein
LWSGLRDQGIETVPLHKDAGEACNDTCVGAADRRRQGRGGGGAGVWTGLVVTRIEGLRDRGIKAVPPHEDAVMLLLTPVVSG